MEIRTFDLNNDFDAISTWIRDERTHMLWCADRIKFPMEKDAFEAFLQDIASRNGDAPYVAADDDGRPVGFYTYSVNGNTHEGMLKFVVVDPEKRGKGIAVEMLNRAVSAAFDDETTEAVHLNVFSSNPRAIRCYEKTGFVLRDVTSGAFTYKDEKWDRYNMIIRRYIDREA